MTAPSQLCARCGRPLVYGAFTCSGCGAAAPRLTAPTRIVAPAHHAPGPQHYGPPPEFGPPPGYRPAPQRSSRSFAVVAVLAVVVAFLLTGGGVWWWVSTHRAQETSTASIPATVPPTVAPEPRAAAATAAALTPGEQLESQLERDRPAVESVVGRWIPQIGSKQVGTVDRGTTYDEAAIWADVLAAKARFPQAQLLRSDDYSSFRRGGFWVLVVAVPFAGPEEANAWCLAEGLGPDDCFAKRLSHSEGPQGNTVPR